MDNIINLQIDGFKCTAVISEIVHRHHKMFKISFNNGYENIFYTDVETDKWIEEDLGFTLLAKEIGNQIKKNKRYSLPDTKILTWHKQYINDKLICFGFYSLINGKQKFYQIYKANKKYMYTLVDMENNEWQILGNSSISGGHIDKAFVSRLIEILPLYTSQVK